MDESDAEMYTTAIFGLLNPQTHALHFTNAGHPPPFLTLPGKSQFLDFSDSDLSVSSRTSHRADVRCMFRPEHCSFCIPMA